MMLKIILLLLPLTAEKSKNKLEYLPIAKISKCWYTADKTKKIKKNRQDMINRQEPEI